MLTSVCEVFLKRIWLLWFQVGSFCMSWMQVHQAEQLLVKQFEPLNFKLIWDLYFLLAAWSQLSVSLSTVLCFFFKKKILLNMGGHTKCVFISKNQHHFLVGWNPVHYTLPDETNESPLRIKGWKMKWFLSEPGPWAHFQGQSVKLLVSGSLNFIQGRNLSTLPFSVEVWPRQKAPQGPVP